MEISINRLGLVTLIVLIISMLPMPLSLGIFFSVLGLILITWLYAKVDKLGYRTTLFNFSLYQWLIAIIPVGISIYFIIRFGTNQFIMMSQTTSYNYLLVLLLVLLLLVLAIINYFVGKSLLLIGEETSNIWFRISGTLTKIGAFTLPILIGLLLICLAQPFFLLGCIIYKPKEDY